MSQDLLTAPRGITATTAATPGTATAPAAPTADGVPFRRLLESLERLVEQHREAPPVQDVDTLQAAMARADQGFAAAMDLRRQLEAAFRARQP